MSVRCGIRPDPPPPAAGTVDPVTVDRAAPHPPGWRATKPGRATSTLTVPDADGAAAVIGVVTVVVRGS